MFWVFRIGLLLCGVYAANPFCLDGERELVVGTRCRRFAECESGIWYLNQCRIGEQFNPRTKSCEATTTSGCQDVEAKCEEGRTFAHQGSSSLYHQCLNGRMHTKYCGAGEVFDHEAEECRVINSLILSKDVSGRSRRSVDAACEEHVKRRDGKSCTRYLECINGVEVNKTCPECMNFDEVRQSCRFSLVLPCGPNSNMPTRPPRPSTTPVPTIPAPQSTPAPQTTPAPQSTPTPQSTPAPQPTPAEQSTPAPQPTPAEQSTPAPQPTTVPQTTPVEQSTPAVQPTTAPQLIPAVQTTPAPK